MTVDLLNEMKKLICILKGGVSNEREISLKTAETYKKACIELGYEVFEIDTKSSLGTIVNELITKKPDIVVNALHGKYGEDGNIQGVLNFLKIPYTHSGVLASSVFMNKYATKLIAQRLGLKVPYGILTTLDNLDQKIKRPFVIKPVDDGSSIGVNIIFENTDLSKVLINYRKNEKILIEQYIKGKEITVGIINGEPIAVTEINNQNLFYDYNAKYSKNAAISSKHILPARISEKDATKAMHDTQKLFMSMNARGAARADLIISSEDNEIYFIEMNSQPGMTETSLVPEQAKFKFGWSTTKLVEEILKSASYDNNFQF